MLFSYVFNINSGSGLDEELDEVIVLSSGGQVEDGVLQRRLRVLHLSLRVLLSINFMPESTQDITLKDA